MDQVHKAILDTVPVIFFLWDIEKKKTVFISKRFYDQSSDTPSDNDTDRGDLRQYVHKNSRRAYDEFFESLLQNENLDHSVEVRAADTLKGIRWMKLSTYPVESDDELKFVAGHISDITKEKETSRLLEEQVESLDTVTFMLAHELSAPVSNMMGLAELLRCEAEEAQHTKNIHLYRTIIHYGQEILTVARGLVNLIEVQAGQKTLELREINLGAFVTDVVQKFYYRLNNHTTNLVSECIPDEATVCVSATDLGRGIDELLIYLLKHLDQTTDRRIVISSPPSPIRDWVLLCVASTAADLPYQRVRAILSQPTRLNQMNVKGSQTRGLLELIIAKEITELHGGKLSLLEADDQGGFVISLPRPEEAKL